jgi:hypothetical protein
MELVSEFKVKAMQISFICEKLVKLLFPCIIRLFVAPGDSLEIRPQAQHKDAWSLHPGQACGHPWQVTADM